MKQNSHSNFMLNEIRKFIDYLDSLSDENKILLASGDISINYSISKKCKKGKSLGWSLDDAEIESIIMKLKAFDNREEAESYLKNMQMSKESYKALVKILDLPYNKKDNLTQMRAKIIEGTVGYRLRSEAIHSEPLF